MKAARHVVAKEVVSNERTLAHVKIGFGFDLRRNLVLRELREMIEISKINHAQKPKGPLSGLKFAITGSLIEMSRDIAADQIRGLGGVFQSALGKDTDYLVVGENVGATKLKKANEYGTKQIDEKSFIKMLA